MMNLNISADCSDIIAHVEHQCALDGRQPTREEYVFIIKNLQQVNAQLLQTIETLNIRCALLSEDRDTSQRILHNKHLEVI